MFGYNRVWLCLRSEFDVRRLLYLDIPSVGYIQVTSLACIEHKDIASVCRFLPAIFVGLHTFVNAGLGAVIADVLDRVVTCWEIVDDVAFFEFGSCVEYEFLSILTLLACHQFDCWCCWL